MIGDSRSATTPAAGEMDHRQLWVSSSCERLLRQAARCVSTLDRDQECVVVAASRGAADDFIRHYCPEGRIGLHRFSLSQLAAELAIPVLAEGRLGGMTQLGQAALAARTSFRFRNSSRLRYLGPVLHLPGFPRALASTILEFRMEKVNPEALQDCGPAGPDLAVLFETYQAEMAQHLLADPATVLESAISGVSHEDCRLAGHPLVLIGVGPRNQLEEELVRALVARSPAAFSFLEEADEHGVERLSRAFGKAPFRVPQDALPESRLERLRTYLFQQVVPERSGTRPDSSLLFFSAPGEGRECLEIARQVRFAVAEGIRFDQIAVGLRSPETYVPLLEDAFGRAGIPGFFSRGVKRPDPAGRAFLALLECASEGLSASRFAEYLSLGQVPQPDESGAPVASEVVLWVEPKDDQLCFKTFAQPESTPPTDEVRQDPLQAPVVAGSLMTPFRWEQLLVDAAVIGGLDRWKNRLRGLREEFEFKRKAATEDEAERRHLDEQIVRLGHLENFAVPLIERLSQLPQTASWGVWVDQLEDLADTALRNPESVLSFLGELRALAEIEPVDLEEVRRVLTDRLTMLRQDPQGGRFGKVFVAKLDELRGRSFDWVFLPGLAEGIFPRKPFEDPLLLDGWRTGIPLPPRLEQKRREERLLLQATVAAARERLIVSYPTIDVAQGRNRVPSFYALDVLRAADGVLPDLRRLEKKAAQDGSPRLGWPAPADPMRAIDDAEFDLALLDPVISSEEKAGEGMGRFLIDSNPHLARSLRARWSRWNRKFWEADGLVDPDAEVLGLLQAQRLRNRSYSPTALQNFAVCPYKFLLYAIHGLRPREEAAALERMDPLTRGGLFHAVQFELFQECQRQELLPFSPANLEQVRELADQVLDRTAERYQEDLAPAIPTVWIREIEAIRLDLKGWIAEVAELAEPWIPQHFELAFGLAETGGRDASSRHEEAVVLNGIRLRGSIDLIETNPDGTRLRVTDHKTGKAPEAKGVIVKGGEILQPILYGLAAEQLLGCDVDEGQLYYCTQTGDYQRIHVPLNAGNSAKFKTVVETIDRAVETGFFPAAPRPDACLFCDYRVICGPYEETRIKRKDRGRLTDLEIVRGLP